MAIALMSCKGCYIEIGRLAKGKSSRYLGISIEMHELTLLTLLELSCLAQAGCAGRESVQTGCCSILVRKRGSAGVGIQAHTQPGPVQ